MADDALPDADELKTAGLPFVCYIYESDTNNDDLAPNGFSTGGCSATTCACVGVSSGTCTLKGDGTVALVNDAGADVTYDPKD